MEKKEFLERIKRQREKVGEVYPIIVTKDGKILDGWHRLEACPNWSLRKTVEPKNPYEEALIWFAAHERRKIDKKEVQTQLIKMAEQLLKQSVAKGEIARKIAEDTGYSLEYVLSMLPSKYKIQEKRKAAIKAVQIKKAYKEEVKKEYEQKAPPKKYLCPICGSALAIVGELLVPYHEALEGSG